MTTVPNTTIPAVRPQAPAAPPAMQGMGVDPVKLLLRNKWTLLVAGVIGQIVSRMVAVQRAQRRELVLANVRLSQHAATLEQLTLSRERNRLARELPNLLDQVLSPWMLPQLIVVPACYYLAVWLKPRVRPMLTNPSATASAPASDGSSPCRKRPSCWA